MHLNLTPKPRFRTYVTSLQKLELEYSATKAWCMHGCCMHGVTPLVWPHDECIKSFVSFTYWFGQRCSWIGFDVSWNLFHSILQFDLTDAIFEKFFIHPFAEACFWYSSFAVPGTAWNSANFFTAHSSAFISLRCCGFQAIGNICQGVFPPVVLDMEQVQRNGSP